jgi:hypothetical protein
VLVVGDHCTDDSGSIVANCADARVSWFNRIENCGSQWGPNNDGLARARGEYVAFLGHDDLWLPWHLKILVPLLDTGADLAHPLGALLAPEGVRGVFAAPPRGESYATTFVPPSGWVVRRSLLDALGGFRDHASISRGTDHDLLRRIARGGYRMAAAPRLSVLKFPSHWWHAYSQDAAVPQQEWILRITTDPHQVERELLSSAVVALTSKTPYAVPGPAFALAFRAGARWLGNTLERDRGFFASLMRARFRRHLGFMRRLRGLSPHD